MEVWHWMYEHPETTPAELKQATVKIAREIWNRFYAPVFGIRDVTLLGVYSHMIHSFLYLPDYPIGHMIARQVEEQLAGAEDYGAEFERLYRMGNVGPDLWMKNATGSSVGPEALLSATENALHALTINQPATR
jgi:oligoendopeptidase F